MDRSEEFDLRAVDEDEGSCPRKQVNRAAQDSKQAGKIERSAEAFRASHCPPSFPPYQFTYENTARVTGQTTCMGGVIDLSPQSILGSGLLVKSHQLRREPYVWNSRLCRAA